MLKIVDAFRKHILTFENLQHGEGKTIALTYYTKSIKFYYKVCYNNFYNLQFLVFSNLCNKISFLNISY